MHIPYSYKPHPPPSSCSIVWFQLLAGGAPLGIKLHQYEGGGVDNVVKIVLSQFKNCIIHVLTTLFLTEIVSDSYNIKKHAWMLRRNVCRLYKINECEHGSISPHSELSDLALYRGSIGE